MRKKTYAATGWP